VAALDDVVERIEQARAANEIVVIRCDWWLTQLDTYQRILAEIDHRGLGDTAILVPAGRIDAETMDNLPELRFGFRATFKQSVRQRIVRLSKPLPSPTPLVQSDVAEDQCREREADEADAYCPLSSGRDVG
jgi:hypothetical protein